MKNFKKSKKQSKRLSEKKALKEGPGAGYTIKVKGLSDINITSASFVDYVEEVGWTFDVSGTCTIDKMSADKQKIIRRIRTPNARAPEQIL